MLVLNAHPALAHEITAALQEQVAECEIVYAPTIELARILIKKREISLIVTSPMLPDGHVSKLQSYLDTLPHPPDVIVFADQDKKSISLFENSGYHFISVRDVRSVSSGPVDESLHKEIRDALNNPLQEIVSLVFLAHTAQCSEKTKVALGAIEHAAERMSQVVWGLEERLCQNVLYPRRGLRAVTR